MLALLLSLGGILGGLVSLKFIILSHIRINRSLGTRLFKTLNKESKWRFVLSQELVLDKKDPTIFNAIYKFNNIFIWFNKTERLFTAGWTPKDSILDIYFFRWNVNKVKNFLRELSIGDKTVSIYAMSPYGTIEIGKMECINFSIANDRDLYEDIESDIVRVLNGEIPKTSALLYGPAGNGKSRFIKYISQKYELPIYTMYFSPDYTNVEILEAFNGIPPNSIVLFEDFDNYFNDRKCIIPSENIKFTFDVLLNCFDGVYNDYNKMIFFMTVNDLDKVSPAIKNRPSRFKYVREFKNPSIELKYELLGRKDLAENIGNISLDQVFKIKDFLELKKDITLDEIKTIL
jgi:hypothetical protein